jgi:hypothetical protein
LGDDFCSPFSSSSLPLECRNSENRSDMRGGAFLKVLVGSSSESSRAAAAAAAAAETAEACTGGGDDAGAPASVSTGGGVGA